MENEKEIRESLKYLYENAESGVSEYSTNIKKEIKILKGHKRKISKLINIYFKRDERGFKKC